jgi:hypothetical protein
MEEAWLMKKTPRVKEPPKPKEYIEVSIHGGEVNEKLC